MTYTTLPDFKVALRDFDGQTALDGEYTRALEAAEATIDNFLGFDVSAEFDSDPFAVPAPIVHAAYILARLQVDALDPAFEQQARGAAEALLRPYRRETGFA
ncbi:MAG: phage gp6-like head-tail connector protein [Xanthomonadales bacterium]|nr:phage gp6-like head-tail connector protein [Xanthomonadales bacterium]